MNRLLSRVPKVVASALRGNLQPIELPHHAVLAEAGQQITHAYFIEQGVVSMLCEFSDGSTAEITTIGREGYLGIGSLLDDDETIARYVVQVPGSARIIRTDVLRRVYEAHPSFRRLLSRYAQALMMQIAQSAACHSVHNAEERLARWLLMTHDRSDGEELLLTQDSLAQMLGVTRPTVTLVARTLQRAGLIRYSRGRVMVTDRRGLEDASCECYRLIRRQYERLLPETYGPTALRSP